MKTLEHQKEPIPFIRNLCKDKSEDELVTIEENFREYLILIHKISNRIER